MTMTTAKTSLKKGIHFVSNLITLIPSRSIFQMLTKNRRYLSSCPSLKPLLFLQVTPLEKRFPGNYLAHFSRHFKEKETA